MTKAVVVVIVALAACESSTPAQIDAFPDVIFDAPVVPPCNPIAQTGCDPGQKCTWVRDSIHNSIEVGEMACVPDGTKLIGAACAYFAAGATTGYDDCAHGLVCNASTSVEMATGTCAAICDTTATAGAAGACAAGFTCTVHASFFANDGDPTTTIGVCDP